VLAQPVEWEQFGSEIIARGITFDAADTLWAITNDVYQLAPGSDAWVEINDIGGRRLLFTTAGTLLVTTPGTVRSTDRGRTFTDLFQRADGGLYEVPADVGSPPSGNAPLAGRLFSGLRIGDFDGAAFSADDGATWTEVPIGDQGTFGGDAQAFLAIPDGEHAGRVVAACYNGLAYSDDGGQTWELSSVWQPFAFAAFAVARLPLGSGPHGGRLLAGVDGPVDGVGTTAVWASDDGGQTWAPLHDFGVPGGRIAALLWAGATAAGEQTVYAVRVFSDVWRSGDGGRTWEALGNVNPERNTNVKDALVGPDGRLYVAQNRSGSGDPLNGVYRTVAPVAVAAEPGTPEAAEAASLAVYPNPAGDTARVTLALAEASEVRVAVYDVLGRAVAVLAEGPHATGTYTVEFDTAGLPAGVYIVRLTANGVSKTRRMTKVR
jgi:hypothetical protein